MQVDFSNNYFELFELPVDFELDIVQLTTRFRSLQRVLHPDRYASASAAERRWSMQATSLVNEAYQCLQVPLARAGYLLSLNGISVDEETDTQMDPVFLMEQMELREALAEATAAADPMSAVDVIVAKLRAGTEQSQHDFNAAFSKADWPHARKFVRQWQFLDKLQREVLLLEAKLDV